MWQIWHAMSRRRQLAGGWNVTSLKGVHDAAKP
jgi:hypothetical protein